MFVLRSYRQRRGPYPLAQESGIRPGIVYAVVALLLLWGAYAGAKGVIGFFGGSNEIQRSGVELTVEERGVVTVSLEGGAPTRATTSIKLYEEDTMQTGPASRAMLTFFDGTVIRADENTSIEIVESTQGSEESTIAIKLTAGSAWVLVPDKNRYAGTILRTIELPAAELTLPSATEAIVGPSMITAFSADELGVAVSLDGNDPIYVGEGQFLTMPEGIAEAADPYGFREPVTAAMLQEPFRIESRQAIQLTQPDDDAGPALPTSGFLTLTEPAQGMTTSASTVRVAGTVGQGVTRVRINGFQAEVGDERSFSHSLAIPEGDRDMTVHVEALDERGITLAEDERTINVELAAVPQPTITAPAANGQTYRTNATELTLRGDAPAGVAGIIVNDYRLQLFNPGDATWSYLAGTRLGNLRDGTNVFNVSAVSESGRTSAPVTLTIVIGQGEGGASSQAPGTDEQPDESTLPQNAPTQPGTLSVSAPTAGLSHAESGTGELLIEGSTAASTASVWVNGYKLRLYKPGATTWNYIASVDLGTMKNGQNEYAVVARDAQNQIIDKMTYTITLTLP